MVVYVIRNLVNDKVYVGKTRINPYSRWLQHLKLANRGDRRALYTALRKYGKNAFSFSVVSYHESYPELNLAEIATVYVYGSLFPNGYNMTWGGDGGSGRRSEETKNKFRASMLGHSVSEKTRALISQSKLGHVMSPGSRLKMSQAKKGVKRGPMSVAQREAISRAKMNHPVTTETRQKQSLSRLAFIARQEGIQSDGKIIY